MKTLVVNGLSIIVFFLLLLPTAYAEDHSSGERRLVLLNTVSLTDPGTVGTSDEKNIVPHLKFFHISSAPPPQLKEDIDLWLSSLEPMSGPPSMGDVFVAAVNLQNLSGQSQWFIHPYAPIVEEVEIFFYSNNDLSKQRIGLYQSGAELHHQGIFVDLPPGQQGILLMVYSSDFYFSNLKVRILDQERLDAVLYPNMVTLLLSLGVLLALLIYNLFLFFTNHEKVYLHLTLCISFLTFGWFNIFGLIQFYPPAINKYLLVAPFIASCSFALQFTRRFLNLRDNSLPLDNIFVILFWGSILILPIIILSPASGMYIAYALLAMMVVISLIAGSAVWKKRYKPARYFIIAYAVLSIQALFWFVGHVIPGLQQDLSLSFVGLISSTLGAILLSLSLAAKVSLFNNENKRLANNLEQKVYERTEALAEANVALEHLISELQEASSAKSNFLANMSHEIRTPLTSIIGYADGILMGDINKEEQERVIRVISENGNHLLHIISDILDISKIEADKLEYEMLPSHITDIVAQVESVMGKRARDKDLEFKLNYQFPMPSEIETDPYRFKQILLNLTNNAIKFTEKGHISIDIRYQNEVLFVSVKDTGIGMSAQRISAIFAPFEQGDSSIARQFGGTGLGLSISKRLAIDLGGDIKAQSEEGVGSSFEVSIRAIPTQNNTMMQSLCDLMQVQEVKQKETTTPDFKGSKVLLVDDHPNNRDLIKIILNRMQIEVTEAEDGDIALQKVFESEFDLILMDIQMPHMKGDEATEKLRQSGYDLPIIALTANNMKHEIEAYMQKGFTGHLSKPIVRTDFIATLSEYLKSKGSTESLFSNDEMLGLVSGYHADLPAQIAQIQQVWADKDVAEFIEIAHRIKGAAGSFGFAALGDKFAEIEQFAKDEELEKVEERLPEVLKYSRLCIAIPGFDIPRGVVNFDLNIDYLLTEIQLFCSNICTELDALTGCVERGENNIALLYLNRITPKAKKLGWQDLHKQAMQLEQQIKLGGADVNNNLKTAESLVNEINKVRGIFK